MKWKYLSLVFIVTSCLISCKKNTVAPGGSTLSIIGKWYITSHKATIYSHGLKIDSVFKTNFTSEDFIQYFSDGTGILSSTQSPSSNLSTFKYTLNGFNLVQISSDHVDGVPETITKLTASNLSIHYTLLVADPDSGVTANETDDYNFSK